MSYVQYVLMYVLHPSFADIAQTKYEKDVTLFINHNSVRSRLRRGFILNEHFLYVTKGHVQIDFIRDTLILAVFVYTGVFIFLQFK